MMKLQLPFVAAVAVAVAVALPRSVFAASSEVPSLRGTVMDDTEDGDVAAAANEEDTGVRELKKKGKKKKKKSKDESSDENSSSTALFLETSPATIDVLPSIRNDGSYKLSKKKKSKDKSGSSDENSSGFDFGQILVGNEALAASPQNQIRIVKGEYNPNKVSNILYKGEDEKDTEATIGFLREAGKGKKGSSKKSESSSSALLYQVSGLSDQDIIDLDNSSAEVEESERSKSRSSKGSGKALASLTENAQELVDSRTVLLKNSLSVYGQTEDFNNAVFSLGEVNNESKISSKSSKSGRRRELESSNSES